AYRGLVTRTCVWLGACCTLRVCVVDRALAVATAFTGSRAVGGRVLGAARLCEFGRMRALHPVWSARIAAMLHPIGAGLLGLLGPAGIAAFAVAYGAGNGMITIACRTLPLAIFGLAGYGLGPGLLSVPGWLSVAGA